MAVSILSPELPAPLQEAPLPSRPEFEKILIEDIPVDCIPDERALFDRIVGDIRLPHKATIFSTNIHGANMAHRLPRFKRLMQQADTMICDGMGILLGSKILPGASFPCRFAAGDFLPALLKRLAREKMTVYFLGGEPGVAEEAIARLSEQVPEHTIVGSHHGYILKDPALEQHVINTINRLQPDILFVGFGMPLQEYWIADRLQELNIRAVFPMGATLDYISKKVQRCPMWLGRLGLEWAFRLMLEPQRMFQRYVVGNPAFLSRICMQSLRLRLAGAVQTPDPTALLYQ